eukprot:g22427.t1
MILVVALMMIALVTPYLCLRWYTNRKLVLVASRSAAAAPASRGSASPKQPAHSEQGEAVDAAGPRRSKLAEGVPVAHKKEKKKDKGDKEEEVVRDPVVERKHRALELACAGCEHPCSAGHAQAPGQVFDAIDYTSTLMGTVKKHKRHLVLCTGQPYNKWPKKLKGNPESSNLEEFLVAKVEEMEQQVGYTIKINVCSLPPESSEHELGQEGDLYVFPDMLKFPSVSLQDVSDILAAIFLAKDPIQAKIPPEPLKEKAYVLVCCHTLRDKRCGVLGPMLVQEIQSAARKHKLTHGVKVLPVSHVGGHAYAGCVITYPSGVWYGRFLPCHAEAFIENHVLKNEPLKPLVRGEVDGDFLNPAAKQALGQAW